MHVTPAAISHQVKALEEHLGLPLFRRLTRALELTDAGRAMLPKLREGFGCLLAAVEQARPAAVRALTVEVSPAFASRWLLPRLQRFSTAHPDIELRVVSSQQAIDRPDADRPGDVIDSGTCRRRSGDPLRQRTLSGLAQRTPVRRYGLCRRLQPAPASRRTPSAHAWRPAPPRSGA
ncbi:MAG: LysR family transcriptional regulator [Rhodocyclaceae bacterium]|nr:LysR family transcriptional regulator [Rhodocyclaceae bacterium]